MRVVFQNHLIILSTTKINYFYGFLNFYVMEACNFLYPFIGKENTKIGSNKKVFMCNKNNLLTIDRKYKKELRDKLRDHFSTESSYIFMHLSDSRTKLIYSA